MLCVCAKAMKFCFIHHVHVHVNIYRKYCEIVLSMSCLLHLQCLDHSGLTTAYTHAHTHTHTFSLSRTLSHIHACTHCHTHTHTHTHSLSLPHPHTLVYRRPSVSPVAMQRYKLTTLEIQQTRKEARLPAPDKPRPLQ